MKFLPQVNADIFDVLEGAGKIVGVSDEPERVKRREAALEQSPRRTPDIVSREPIVDVAVGTEALPGTLPNGRSDDRFSRVIRAQPRGRLDTPRPLRSSRTPAYRDRFPWQRLHLFWGDERCVPHDHPDSNYGMVHATVIAHAPSGRRNPDIAVA